MSAATARQPTHVLPNKGSLGWPRQAPSTIHPHPHPQPQPFPYFKQSQRSNESKSLAGVTPSLPLSLFLWPACLHSCCSALAFQLLASNYEVETSNLPRGGCGANGAVWQPGALLGCTPRPPPHHQGWAKPRPFQS